MDASGLQSNSIGDRNSSNAWKYLSAPGTSSAAARSQLRPSSRSEGRTGRQTKLVALTYNTWFADVRYEKRCAKILEICKEKQADFICLQEVLPIFMEKIKGTAWVRKNYDVSPFCPPGGRYGIVMLVRSDHSPRFRSHTFPSRMGRMLLTAECTINGKPMMVASAHFESLESHLTREAQLAIASRVLKPYRNSLLLGDFNFCSYWNPPGVEGPLQNDCLKRILPDHADIWSLLRQDKGYTYDSTRNSNIRKFQQWRYDRTMAKLVDWEAKSIGMVGQEPMDALTGTLPSNHFGLCSSFDWVSRNDNSSNITMIPIGRKRVHTGTPGGDWSLYERRVSMRIEPIKGAAPASATTSLPNLPSRTASPYSFRHSSSNVRQRSTSPYPGYDRDAKRRRSNSPYPHHRDRRQRDRDKHRSNSAHRDDRAGRSSSPAMWEAASDQTVKEMSRVHVTCGRYIGRLGVVEKFLTHKGKWGVRLDDSHRISCSTSSLQVINSASTRERPSSRNSRWRSRTPTGERGSRSRTPDKRNRSRTPNAGYTSGGGRRSGRSKSYDLGVRSRSDGDLKLRERDKTPPPRRPSSSRSKRREYGSRDPIRSYSSRVTSLRPASTHKHSSGHTSSSNRPTSLKPISSSASRTNPMEEPSFYARYLVSRPNFSAPSSSTAANFDANRSRSRSQDTPRINSSSRNDRATNEQELLKWLKQHDLARVHTEFAHFLQGKSHTILRSATPSQVDALCLMLDLTIDERIRFRRAITDIHLAWMGSGARREKEEVEFLDKIAWGPKLSNPSTSSTTFRRYTYGGPGSTQTTGASSSFQKPFQSSYSSYSTRPRARSFGDEIKGTKKSASGAAGTSAAISSTLNNNFWDRYMSTLNSGTGILGKDAIASQPEGGSSKPLGSSAPSSKPFLPGLGSWDLKPLDTKPLSSSARRRTKSFESFSGNNPPGAKEPTRPKSFRKDTSAAGQNDPPGVSGLSLTYKLPTLSTPSKLFSNPPVSRVTLENLTPVNSSSAPRPSTSKPPQTTLKSIASPASVTTLNPTQSSSNGRARAEGLAGSSGFGAYSLLKGTSVVERAKSPSTAAVSARPQQSLVGTTSARDSKPITQSSALAVDTGGGAEPGPPKARGEYTGLSTGEGSASAPIKTRV